MTAKPAQFYDRALKTTAGDYLLPLAESRYLPLYALVGSLIEGTESVCELGCGTGRFAALLDAGSRPGSYVGIDFSREMVAEAQRYTGLDVFILADLREMLIPTADVYVAIEVMEHLDDDLELLRRLPPHRRVILTVPSYEAEAHVRWFPERGQPEAHFSEALIVETVRYVNFPGKEAFVHVIEGRTPAW